MKHLTTKITFFPNTKLFWLTSQLASHVCCAKSCLRGVELWDIFRDISVNNIPGWQKSKNVVRDVQGRLCYAMSIADWGGNQEQRCSYSSRDVPSSNKVNIKNVSSGNGTFRRHSFGSIFQTRRLTDRVSHGSDRFQYPSRNIGLSESDAFESG